MRKWRRTGAWVFVLVATGACEPGDTTTSTDHAARAGTGKRPVAYTEAAHRSLAGSSTGQPRSGGTLTQAITQPPDTLHNLLRRTRTARVLCERFLFPPLLEIDPDSLELVPRLAADRPEFSTDDRTLTWRLRKEVFWHRGHADGSRAAVTTRDVQFTWDLMRDPAVAAEHVRGALDQFQELHVIDEHTFQTVVSELSFRAAQDFGTGFPLMPAHLAVRDPDAMNADPLGFQPVGYGPYRLEQWADGSHLTLVRVPDWQERARPHYFERLRFLFLEDSTLALPLFRRGELDLTAVQDPLVFEQARDDPELRERATFHRYAVPQWNVLGWNLAHPVLSDVRVRRALTHLYPRRQVCEELYHGAARVLNGPLGPEASGPRDADAPRFDPAAARRLLAEAGLADSDGDGALDRDGQRFEFTLLHSSTLLPALDRANLLFQQELRRVGIVVHLERLEFPSLVARMREHDFDACQFARTPPARDDDLYPFFHSSQADGGNNFVAYRSAECDALLEQFRRELDGPRRAVLARRIDARIRADQPYTFLWSPDSLVLASTRLRGVRVTRLGARPFDWWVADQ